MWNFCFIFWHHDEVCQSIVWFVNGSNPIIMMLFIFSLFLSLHLLWIRVVINLCVGKKGIFHSVNNGIRSYILIYLNIDFTFAIHSPSVFFLSSHHFNLSEIYYGVQFLIFLFFFFHMKVDLQQTCYFFFFVSILSCIL